MDVGIQLVFASDGWPGVTDGQVYEEEIRLARLADELGFDVVWSAEHHFFGYSFCPDNTQLLSYLAGVTERIEVGTAAVIMPWNEPLRVAEKIALLDQLTDGRTRFGMGRGLSRREYAGFRGIEMDESRGRFDEGSLMVKEALETGFIEGDGPYYPQERVELRPRPSRSFADRLYAVASSDDSIESAARLAARMVMFADRSWEHRMPSVVRWRELFEEYHGVAAPPPLTADFAYCHENADVAAERGKRHLGIYLASVLEHYEVMGDHFAETDGYDAYARAADVLRKIGESGFLNGFLSATAHGTPGPDSRDPRPATRPSRTVRARNHLSVRRDPLRRGRGLDAIVRSRGPARPEDLGVNTMKFGMLTVNHAAGIRPEALAIELEQRGFDSIWVPEHPHIPTSRESPYPSGGDLPPGYHHMMDPFVSLAAAAVTSTNLRLCTGICLLLEHDLLDLACKTSTLDVLSDGRLTLGIGVGWNREELANHRGDIPFRLRYSAMRERVEALRAVWTQETAAYDGRWDRFTESWVYPKPVQPSIPVALGNAGPVGIKHAAEYADEWCPIDASMLNRSGKPHVDEAIDQFRNLAAEAGRDPLSIPISIFLWGRPRQDRIEHYANLGVDRVVVTPSSFELNGPDHMLAQLDEVRPVVEAFA